MDPGASQSLDGRLSKVGRRSSSSLAALQHGAEPFGLPGTDMPTHLALLALREIGAIGALGRMPLDGRRRVWYASNSCFW